jgi:hypothetical protein
MNPKLKIVIDYCFMKLEQMIISLVVSGIIGGCVYWKEHGDVKWIGKHLNDKQQEIQQVEDNQ